MPLKKIESIGEISSLIEKYKEDFLALENNCFHPFLCGPTMKINGMSWMVVFKDSKQNEPRKTIIQFVSKSRAIKIANVLNEALKESKKR